MYRTKGIHAPSPCIGTAADAAIAQCPPSPGADRAALAEVLRLVQARDYRFTTVTPLTQQRVLASRQGRAAASLRDVFGWNQPFAPDTVGAPLFAAMRSAGVLREYGGGLFTSGVRISTIGCDLFVHSAYPTTAEDAVFFGPDTCRFAGFIQRELRARPGAPARILDVGCGSGAGGLVAARAWIDAGLPPPAVTMNDINPLALAYTAVNADVAGISVMAAQGDALSAVAGEFDLIVSNPPYLVDARRRAYRHGGARLGRALSVRIAAESLGRLAPGGMLLLYTGVAIVDGIDPLREELQPLLRALSCTWSYRELDPDVFGEELESPAYAHADRIAAVGLAVRRTGGGG
ncbi:MAG: class I SAM-dependent methyltransferase [Pseudomonadota bacterium]